MRFTLFLLLSTLFLFGIDKEATVSKPLLLNANPYEKWCYISALPLRDYYKTNYIAELSDGSFRQYAGIRFLAEDLEAIESRVINIYAIDTKTEEKIDARSAYFVVNSKAKGTETRFSKFAFKNRSDAEEFMKKYGGDIRDFDFALFLAKRDIEEDEKYFATSKERTIKKGRYIYEKFCKNIEPNDYYAIFVLKQEIIDKKLCPSLKETDLHAVTLYLWERKRGGDVDVIEGKMEIPKNAKCPVCGMFVAKYPKWAAKMDAKGKTYFFDGVKDMFKFYLSPKEYKTEFQTQDFENIRVTDYYTLKEIDGRNAYFVVGSNVYGPMGNELIPFEKEEDANSFKKEHLGKKVLKFDKIDKKLIESLDK